MEVFQNLQKFWLREGHGSLTTVTEVLGRYEFANVLIRIPGIVARAYTTYYSEVSGTDMEVLQKLQKFWDG